MILNEPSDEQKEIINALENYSVIVDSVAGSGKTTTILHVAKKYNNQSILLLTYNKKLRLDTKKKIEYLNLHNLEVHTYHSFYCKYYDHICFDDQKIRKIINESRLRNNNYHYDMIILDECQDMNPLYYESVHKIFKDNDNYNIKLCILGDKYQSIYEYNGADSRFITEAENVFAVNDRKWIKLKLSVSFRLTEEMAIFINKCILREERIKTLKNNDLVRYIICNCFSDIDDRVYNEVKYYLSKGYKNDDIFVLAPSVRSEKSPIRILENKLTSEGIKLFVPNNDEEKLDEDILKNKLVFSSFHQVKGLERKVCIVFGIDNSYFKYYKKDANETICPNEIYVALTRATEKMSLLHHEANNYLPFMDIQNINKYCYYEYAYINEHKNKFKIKSISVTELLRHLSSEILEKAISYVRFTKLKEKSEKIGISIKTQQGELYETVSEITGTAIPAYYELVTNNKMTIYDYITKNNLTDLKNKKIVYMFGDYKDDVDDVDETMKLIKGIKVNANHIKPEELLLIANKYCSLISGFNHKMNQIKEYKWLTQDNLNKAVERMKNNISNNSIFEIKYNFTNFEELKGHELSGIVDCIDTNTIHEFKCVQELKTEHFLQVALYKYLFLMNRPLEYDYILNSEEYGNYQIGDIVRLIYDDTEMVVNKVYKNGNIGIKLNNKTVKFTNNDLVNITSCNKISEKYKNKYDKKIVLTNILTDETYEINSDIKELKELVKLLIENKYNPKIKINNEIFIKNMNHIASKYILINNKRKVKIIKIVKIVKKVIVKGKKTLTPS